MRKDLMLFVQDTERKHADGMKTRKDLRSRLPSAQDWLDSVVLGGATLEDLLDGATDADVSPEVVAAFHAQYPNLESFTQSVREHAHDPQELQGLISGVKGKLFEQEYVIYLNDGHLPQGYVAELAASPTQPGFDVLVKGADGEVSSALQLKASADVSYLKETVERYPEYEVVVPTDVFDDLGDRADLGAHLIDGATDLTELESRVTEAVEAAEGITPDPFPELAFLFIAASAAVSLYRGKDKRKVMIDSTSRAAKAGVSAGAGWLAAMAIDPFVALPVSVLTRLAMGRREISTGLKDNLSNIRKRISKIEAEIAKGPGGDCVRLLSAEHLMLKAREE